MKHEKLKYGLIGKTLDHSFSKHFFSTKFRAEQINAVFENIELEDESALEMWMQTNAHEYAGLCVTIPYKQTIISCLDELDPVAKEIGAVNCIQIVNGRKIGHNTDAFGFSQSIKPFLRNVHERALILGTGGASKAVAYSLRKLGITVGFLSRKPQQDEMIFGYDQANQNMVNSFLMIVNSTPLGTHPNIDEQPDFPIELVGKDHFVVDLIYNPSETKFLEKARISGADTLNGLSMLKQQALKAWEIWNS